MNWGEGAEQGRDRAETGAGQSGRGKEEAEEGRREKEGEGGRRREKEREADSHRQPQERGVACGEKQSADSPIAREVAA